MRASIIAASLVLSACATSAQQASADLRTSLDAMVGQPVAVAVARLGEPIAAAAMESRSVYGWGYGFTRTEFTNAAAGWVSPGEFQGGIFPAPRRTLPDSCVIRMVVGPDGLIQEWDYQGGDRSCGEYADRLVNHSLARID